MVAISTAPPPQGVATRPNTYYVNEEAGRNVDIYIIDNGCDIADPRVRVALIAWVQKPLISYSIVKVTKRAS